RFYDLLKSSLVIDLIIGLIFATFILFFGRVVLSGFYGFRGALLNLSTIYLKIMSPYILLTLINFSLTNLLRVQKKAESIMAIGLGSSLLDVLLNSILVPKLGITGAALSAIISLSVISLSYLILVYPVILNALPVKSTTKLELITFGLPLAGQEVLESVLFIMVFDALIARLGVSILTIYSVVSQLLSIARIPSFVYSTTISVFLPEAEKGRKVKQFLKLIFTSAYIATLIISVIVVFASNALAHFLSNEIVTNIMPITLFTLIIMGMSPVYEGAKMLLQSSDDEKYVLSHSIIINLLSVGVMLVIQLLGQQTYYSMYFIYGLSLLLLSVLFMKRYLQKCTLV
ncbi:MATE family efflux transporter, partial [Streptococcus merionis]|uniref:MATE family efflux transporter n=1 Tax=Streptococcus merionis TaxID=400065 RepID=UPI0026EC583D